MTNPAINTGTDAPVANPAEQTLRQFAQFVDDKKTGTVPPPAANADTPPPAGDTPPPPVVDEYFQSLTTELFDEQTRATVTKENFASILKERLAAQQASQTNVRDDIDEDLLKHNAFIKTTGIRNHDLYDRIAAKDKSALTALDWKLLGTELDYAKGGKPLSAPARERLKEQIMKDYNLHDDEDNPVDPVDKEIGEARLAGEARRVQGEIEEIFKKVGEAVPDRTKIDAVRAENYTKWDTAMASEVSNKDNRKLTLKIDLGTADNQPVNGALDFDFEIPDADYQKYIKTFGDFAKNTWQFGDYKNELKANLERMAWVEHKDTILQSVAKMVMERTHAAMIGTATNTNPAGKVINTDTPPPTFDASDPKAVLLKYAELNKK